MRLLFKFLCLCVVIFSSYIYASDPNLVISGTAVSWNVLEDSTNPDPNILTITNGGGGILNWSANLTDKPDWLTMTPVSGTLSQGQSEPVTLSADISNLSAGQHSYVFEVLDPAALNSPQTVTVNLGVGGVYVPIDYPTVQAAIDAAVEGYRIIVFPGTYTESINFHGKNIILTSIDPENPSIVESTVIKGNGDSVVTFSGTETSDCQLQGFRITGGFAYDGGGIYGRGTQATIANCIISGNKANFGGGLSGCGGAITNCIIAGNYTADEGGWASPPPPDEGVVLKDAVYSSWYTGPGGGLIDCDGPITNCTIACNRSEAPGPGLYSCNGPITNCIIWGNTYSNSPADQLYNCSIPTYSCIQYWPGGGIGNISNDPFFVNLGYFTGSYNWKLVWTEGDYHLKSQHGRCDMNTLRWVYDPNNTSPCIDAGDPASIDWQNELWPHGKRINMGAYGGTPLASISPNSIGNIADLDHDGVVGPIDFMLFSDDWLQSKFPLDTDLNRDGCVDITDFAELANHWLWLEQ